MDFEEELNNRSNEERKMLERAKKFIQSHQSLDSDIFREYLFLFEAYQKLLKESQFVYKISDTYQMKLMVIKEELYYEIQQKKETEKILKEKINELLETQRELEVINKKLEKISSRDHLTGLYNRQEFEKVIHREWNDSIREEKPISMMMIDIDNFKAFNDNYGHIAGDHCLQKISKVIDNALNRPRDFLARFGGEEFVVILPKTDEVPAREIGERIRESIEEAKIPHLFSSVSKVVTVSIGISTTEEAVFFTFEELLDKADQALYDAKGSGKNKCSFKELS